MNNVKESFYNIVLASYPPISKLSERKRFALTQILFNSVLGASIPHKMDNTKFVLANDYLNKTFGCSTSFRKLNEELNIFQFSGYWDASRRLAKEVNVRRIVGEKFWLHIYQTADIPDYLLNERGRRILKPPTAILSKDKQGKTKAIRPSLASRMVPVDRDKIKMFLEFLNQQEWLLLNKRPIHIPRIKDRTKAEQKEWIVRAKLQSLGILYSSSLKSLPDEHLLQCYRECDSGRLQGIGFHLQNLLREVKNTALAGKWDHDIESCHYTLTHQIAKKHGYKAGAIEEYIKNKGQIHQHFVDSYGISKDDTKKCMLSLIYGAPLTAYTGATIYRVLEEKSEVFKNDKTVQSVKKELVKCKALLIKDGIKSRGKMKNAIGKCMSISKKSQKSLASHILQGYEALALHTAIEQLDGNILLLCHDGFVTETDIDTSGISQSYYEKTGLEINFKSEQLASIVNF